MMDKPVNVGDTVKVSRFGPDGRIWLDAEIIKTGKVSFVAKLPGDVRRLITYNSDQWRMPA